jgi:hypothetical protein
MSQARTPGFLMLKLSPMTFIMATAWASDASVDDISYARAVWQEITAYES